jgi:hypothetical protein
LEGAGVAAGREQIGLGSTGNGLWMLPLDHPVSLCRCRLAGDLLPLVGIPGLSHSLTAPANVHFLRQQLRVKSERRHVAPLPVKEAPVALVKPVERVGVLRHELAVQLS